VTPSGQKRRAGSRRGVGCRQPHGSPVELVRYTADSGGSLTITRDRELTLDVHLYVYPNYFGVGTPPFPQYTSTDIEQTILKLAQNIKGFSPAEEGGLRAISPERYPVLKCDP
jgi:hypothetical protein